VNEIFYSIQGESSWSGQPCVFIRLTGCNLRCAYCDTSYAYEQGRFIEIPEIVERVRHSRCNLVEVTGGEPLIQAETPSLIAGLLDAGHTVLMETNGSLDISRIDPRCFRIVDLKCPSSGEAEQNDFENLGRLTPSDELKFVIGSREDYDFAREVLQRMDAQFIRMGHVHFSPVFGDISPEVLVSWILEDHLPVRLSLQLHKIIWGPNRTGV
jgi:7-carboxy-7-deazaguanine synthase